MCAPSDARALPALCGEGPSTCLLSPNTLRLRTNWAKMCSRRVRKVVVFKRIVVFTDDYFQPATPPLRPPGLASRQSISFSSGVGLMSRRMGALTQGVSPTKHHCCAYIHQRPPQGSDTCQPCSPPTTTPGAWHLNNCKQSHAQTSATGSPGFMDLRDPNTIKRYQMMANVFSLMFVEVETCWGKPGAENLC